MVRQWRDAKCLVHTNKPITKDHESISFYALTAVLGRFKRSSNVRSIKPRKKFTQALVTDIGLHISAAESKAEHN